MLYENEHFDFTPNSLNASITYCGSLFLKELGVNFLADDLSPDIVFLGQTQPHLLQNKLYLLLLLHRAKGLHLKRGHRVKESLRVNR